MALRQIVAPWEGQPNEVSDGLALWLGQAGAAVAAHPMRSIGVLNAANVAAAEAVSAGLRAIRLTGSGGYLTAPARAGTTPWTLLSYGVWRSAAASSVITMAEAPGNATYDRSLHLSSTGLVCGYLYDGAGKESQSALTITAGVPVLIAVVCTGSSLTSYIDGIGGTPTAVSSAGFNAYTTPETVFGYGGGLGGGGTNGSATLASNWDAAYALKIDGILSEAALRDLAGRPWDVFEPRRIWVPVSAGGGDASVALTGAATTSSPGAIAAAGGAATALTGAATASAAGTVSASASTDASASLTGAAAVSAAGTASAAGGATVAVTGAQAASAAGTAGASGDASTELAGAGTTSTAGTTDATAGGNATAALVGSGAASAAGTMAATGDATAEIVGASSASSAGTVDASIGTNATVALTGAAVAASAGALVLNGAAQIVLTGASCAASAGTISAVGQIDAAVALSGAAAIAACGNMAASSDALSPNSAAPSGHGPAFGRRGAVLSTGRRSNMSTRTR